MSEASTFAARLRELRTDAKMTQQELAARSGVHRQTIAQLELATRKPTWGTVQALARALGVSCQAFEMEDAEAEAPPPKRKRRKK